MSVPTYIIRTYHSDKTLTFFKPINYHKSTECRQQKNHFDKRISTLHSIFLGI